ncbi:DUF4253 domain-containing protein [Synechocystis sp. LKSZ1]|uniref:DUF4253 domain-containing protein n=1 Tax=Synechocystis sp. LKSZ1 TaxID=3144951 RepID=UPI00336BE314
MDKYQILREKQTNGDNYDLDTADIIERLQKWDRDYGIVLSGVESDRLVVVFQQLPADLDSLAQEIYQFCPDIIDQHFGCFDDLFSGPSATWPPELQEFLAGIDFEDENFGLELLKRSLAQSSTVGLWWD